MHRTPPIRVTRAGGSGRADVIAFGTSVTVLTSSPRTIATAALVVQRRLTETDLSGGGARARATDRLAGHAARAARCGVLVSLGGDVSVAGPAPTGGWKIRIDDGTAAASPVRLSSGGLATVPLRRAGSASRTLTVAAGSCRLARAAAAAAAQHGEKAAEWLSSIGTVARLVSARA